MCYERFKGKIFLARKDIKKSENVRQSVFISCMLKPNDIEQFQAVFSNLLASAEFSSKSKLRKSPAHVNRLDEYILMLSLKF